MALNILGIAHYSIPSTPAASWTASFQPESWELVYGFSALFWVMLSNCLWEFPLHYVLTIIFTVQAQKNLELSM
jgi:hypothetical protein